MNITDLLAQVLSKIPLSYLSTDTTLAANSDQLIASQKATKAYVDAIGVTVAWTPFTPTVTALSGTITSYTASGRYLKVGKTLHLSMSISITNAGTAATGIVATLPPSNTAAADQTVNGREKTTGSALQGIVVSGGSAFSILTYNNSFPGATGNVLVLTGVIEVQ